MRRLGWLLSVLLACALALTAAPAAGAGPARLQGTFELSGIGSYEEIVFNRISARRARMGYLVDYEARLVRWGEVRLRNGRWVGTLRFRLGRWRYVMHWKFRVTGSVLRDGERYASRIAGRMHGSFANGESTPRWRFRGKCLNLPPGRKPPRANFWYEPENPSVSAATNTLHFRNQSFDRGPTPYGIVGYFWDFGDPASGAANNSTLEAPSHTFAAPGAYPVTLTVTDDDGMTDSITFTVTVAP